MFDNKVELKKLKMKIEESRRGTLEQKSREEERGGQSREGRSHER